MANFRQIAMVLAVLPCPSVALGHENSPKKTPFQETAASLLGGTALQLIDSWHFPHFASWARYNVNADTIFRRRFRSFPDDLISALADQDAVNQEAAVSFLATYTSLARAHAAQLVEKNLSLAVDLALAPHTEKIRKALLASLRAKSPRVQLMAALTLLSLDERHVKANEILLASATSADAELLGETSHWIGVARLATPQVIEHLRQLLQHRDKSVRHKAVGAVITMGPAARELTPAVMRLLKTGKDAEGAYSYPFAMALPQQGNLALMALESLEEHAKAAAPALVTRFPKANTKDQITILGCLGNIGLKDDACLAIVRKCLENEKPNLKLAAACTLLRLAPADRQATDLLKKALADETTRSLVVGMCQRFGPPSPEIVATFVSMLDSKNENTRIEATRALAQIGPHARQAISAIEKLLAKDEDGRTHTFQSTRAAALALSKIRGKEAAAALLRVADSNAGGARYAMIYLCDFGDDLPPNTLAVLVRAMEKEDGPRDSAAIALCNLGERARPVRRDLEPFLEVPEIGWIIDTALRRIPAKKP